MIELLKVRFHSPQSEAQVFLGYDQRDDPNLFYHEVWKDVGTALRFFIWSIPPYELQPNAVFLGSQSRPQLSVKESKSCANYVFNLRFEAPFGQRSTFTPHMSDRFQKSV